MELSTIIVDVITGAFFATLYAIKGGWLGAHLTNYNKIKQRSRLLDTVLGGKFILAVFSAAYFLLMEGFTPMAVLMLAAWLLGVAPSMGEENGAVGDMQGWWGEYKDKGFSRSYGVKKAVQRGMWLLAPAAMVSGDGYLLLTAVWYVPVVFVFQDLKRMITGIRDWAWTEPAIGFMCGLAFAIHYSMKGM